MFFQKGKAIHTKVSELDKPSVRRDQTAEYRMECAIAGALKIVLRGATKTLRISLFAVVALILVVVLSNLSADSFFAQLLADTSSQKAIGYQVTAQSYVRVVTEESTFDKLQIEMDESRQYGTFLGRITDWLRYTFGVCNTDHGDIVEVITYFFNEGDQAVALSSFNSRMTEYGNIFCSNAAELKFSAPDACRVFYYDRDSTLTFGSDELQLEADRSVAFNGIPDNIGLGAGKGFYLVERFYVENQRQTPDFRKGLFSINTSCVVTDKPSSATATDLLCKTGGYNTLTSNEVAISVNAGKWADMDLYRRLMIALLLITSMAYFTYAAVLQWNVRLYGDEDEKKEKKT